MAPSTNHHLPPPEESRRKNIQMSKMESLSIHSHDTSFYFTMLAILTQGQGENKINVTTEMT